MNIFALVSDAYGGHGGIAVFNRDVLEALALHPDVRQIVVLPRQVSRPIDGIPQKISFSADAATGNLSYLKSLISNIPNTNKSDLIYCGHINLAPLALGLSRLFRVPVLGALFGIEAWQPRSRKITNISVRKFDRYFSISRITRDRFIKWSGVTRKLRLSSAQRDPSRKLRDWS